MHQLVLQDIRKTFGRTVAVEHFNLAVEEGEFVALLGPSGCGKTTTLRVIAGFERPDTGRVLIRGADATSRPPYHRDIGVVFQNYALFPHMTVAENVAYGLRMRKVARDALRERVRAALQLVHLEGLEGRYPRQLSGGQQQRVAVARAIVIRPSVLLFDEPLSNLDARLRQEMRRELRQLQRSLKISTIFVTHDQEEALSMADRVVVMNAGRIEQVGNPEEIYRHPATAFVASFIGECNVLEGEIRCVEATGVVFSVRGGATFRLPLQPGFRSGAAGRVTIRPEDMTIVGVDDAVSPGDVNLSGVVRTLTYLGPVSQYEVALDGGLRVLVSEQGRRRAGRRIAEGDPVRVSWPVEACSLQLDGEARP
jgi:putative spermidine/putrescine transport system ATP-binding protein